MDKAEPTDVERPRNALADVWRRVLEEAGAKSDTADHEGFRLSDWAQGQLALAREPVGPPEVLTAADSPLIARMAEEAEAARQRAALAERRAARADELAIASSRREAPMEKLAVAAEARDGRREQREQQLFPWTIAATVCAFIAAVGSIVAIIVSIVLAR